MTHHSPKPENLDPGIRETVHRLIEWGFYTTDSGDGESKFASGAADDCTLRFPHVFAVVDPALMISESHRLLGLLDAAGVREPHVEVTYAPADGVAILSLHNVTDKSWRKTP